MINNAIESCRDQHFEKNVFHSFLASEDFCRLLITLANSLDTDQDQQTLFKINSLKKKNHSRIPSERQTDWIQIRPDLLSDLIWVQIVC